MPDVDSFRLAPGGLGSGPDYLMGFRKLGPDAEFGIRVPVDAAGAVLVAVADEIIATAAGTQLAAGRNFVTTVETDGLVLLPPWPFAEVVVAHRDALGGSLTVAPFPGSGATIEGLSYGTIPRGGAVTFVSADGLLIRAY